MLKVITLRSSIQFWLRCTFFQGLAEQLLHNYGATECNSFCMTTWEVKGREEHACVWCMVQVTMSENQVDNRSLHGCSSEPRGGSVTKKGLCE